MFRTRRVATSFDRGDADREEKTNEVLVVNVPVTSGVEGDAFGDKRQEGMWEEVAVSGPT